MKAVFRDATLIAINSSFIINSFCYSDNDGRDDVKPFPKPMRNGNIKILARHYTSSWGERDAWGHKNGTWKS